MRWCLRLSEDPITIIKHLMVGSEGTLGFVSNVTYNTVPEWPHKVNNCVLHAIVTCVVLPR